MKCSICSAKIEEVLNFVSIPFSVFWDFDKQKVNFTISICSECGFIFQSSAYNQEEFDKISSTAYLEYDMANHQFPDMNLKSKGGFDFLRDNINFNKIKNILEIGSGRGDFLYLLKEEFKEVNILGCEPSTKESFIPTVNSFFKKELFSNRFDLIIFRFVLEHIKFPNKFLKDVSQSIEDGYIYIEVPNVDFYMNNYINEFCPEHINYFSLISLTNLLSISGFEVITSSNTTDTIYLLAKKSSKKITLTFEKDKKSLLKNYFNEREKFFTKVLNYIDSGKKIIFYGAGNMFIWNFYTLNIMFETKNMSLKEATFCVIDDNKTLPPKTKFFNIDLHSSQKLESINKRDYIVIISIANLQIAQKIKSKLSGFEDILIPWSLNG